jgi:hypothetical protein
LVLVAEGRTSPFPPEFETTHNLAHKRQTDFEKEGASHPSHMTFIRHD